jgi:hypothetical protein
MSPAVTERSAVARGRRPALIMAYPIDLFCVHHLADTECLEADQLGGSVRRYQELFASLAAAQTRLQSHWPGHQGRIFIHCRSYRERTHLQGARARGLARPGRSHGKHARAYSLPATS